MRDDLLEAAKIAKKEAIDAETRGIMTRTQSLSADFVAKRRALAARLRTYATETLPALERDALGNDRIRRDLLCPSCGASMHYSHGKCMDCGRSCGCSFNPTSGADWCRAHKPQPINVPAILAARRAAATPNENTK